jgi:hypothetical protein
MCGPLLRYDTVSGGNYRGACLIVSEYSHVINKVLLVLKKGS